MMTRMEWQLWDCMLHVQGVPLVASVRLEGTLHSTRSVDLESSMQVAWGLLALSYRRCSCFCLFLLLHLAPHLLRFPQWHACYFRFEHQDSVRACIGCSSVSMQYTAKHCTIITCCRRQHTVQCARTCVKRNKQHNTRHTILGQLASHGDILVIFVAVITIIIQCRKHHNILIMPEILKTQAGVFASSHTRVP